MNPWEIFGWVAALSLSAVVVAFSVAVVAAMFTRAPKRDREVLRGK